MPSLVTDLKAESITHLFLDNLTCVDLIIDNNDKVSINLWQSNICIKIHLNTEDLAMLVHNLKRTKLKRGVPA